MWDWNNYLDSEMYGRFYPEDIANIQQIESLEAERAKEETNKQRDRR